MKEIMNLPTEFSEINIKDLIWITDHTFGNIFVCDINGKIIFLNQKAADTFGLTKEQTLLMNTRDIVGNKLIDRSTTLESLEKKEVVIGSFKSCNGLEYFAISTPLLNENGDINFVMTYSQEKSLMTTFFDIIEKERKQAEKYKNAYSHIISYSNTNNMIISYSEKMKSIYQNAEKIAKTDSTVLILGETGTGKDVFSNFIHSKSLRASEPIIPVNCSAIPLELMESEFFGYEKGAFTGANKEGKPGLFELANNGTLFLDEVAELSMPMQTKLLRVLENGEFTRIGGTKIIKSNARLIVATNRNLSKMVEQKLFREDLYYRINIIPMEIPPLRERKEEILPLATHFLSKLNQKYSLNRQLSPVLMESLTNYKWPGNIRELKNIIERLVITSSNDLLESNEMISIFENHNPNSINKPSNLENKNNLSLTNNLSKDENLTIEEYYKKIEKEKIINALIETNGNKLEAAKLLGISTGKLYRKLKQ